MQILTESLELHTPPLGTHSLFRLFDSSQLHTRLSLRFLKRLAIAELSGAGHFDKRIQLSIEFCLDIASTKYPA
jgi:hypothetical protein